MDLIERARLVAEGASCFPESAMELDRILIAFALRWKAGTAGVMKSSLI